MQIDWFTVGAQVANFLVLVWLLQHFLYGPVTGAMQRRETRIRDRLEEAAQSKAAADAEAEALRAQQQALEHQRGDLLEAARTAAEEERKSLQHAAREEVEAHRLEWLGQLEAQRTAFLRDLRRRSAEGFLVLARQALGDLADADLQEKMALSFLDQLERLDAATWTAMQRGAQGAGTITIHSRYPLSDDVRERTTAALRRHLGPDAAVAFETGEDVSCGMMLRAGSRTVAWSLDSYLDGFEELVAEQLTGARSGAHAGSETDRVR